jgi:selenoprotein W-related protein
MSKLLEEYESQVKALTLIPSDGGKFEVVVNGELLFSKLSSNRHTDPEEILGLFQNLT